MTNKPVFGNRLPAMLWLLSCLLPLRAQVHSVDPHKTTTFEVAGATAAYSLDSSFAEASAEQGVVSVEGKQPGTTQIVVISPLGAQTFEILITTPPPNYPPGFVAPVNIREASESAYIEDRYYSSPAQLQSQADFLKGDGTDWTHVHLVETSLAGQVQAGQPRFALSSASYQIVSPRRDITLFDKYVEESPLTINGSIVRGIHVQQGNWFFHAGYASVQTFEGLFLPTQPEFVAGGGYRHKFNRNSSITGSFYHIQVHRSDPTGRTGNVGDLRYSYKPRETFWFVVDLGISRGIAGSGRLNYKSDRDTLTSLVRYMPLSFASLGANSVRGLHADVSWTHHFTKNFGAASSFYNNNLVMPGLKESTISAAFTLTYQLTGHWSVTGGALASRFQTQSPATLAIESYTLPAGLAFQSRHFGATGQYQFAATHGQDAGGKQFRTSLHSGWGAFVFTGYAERDTNAPTLSFIFGQLTGLQQLLDQLSLKATTVQQVDELLSGNASLIAGGYIKGATINLVPVRTQLGGTAEWSSRGAHRIQLRCSFLYNDNHLLQGSTQDAGHTLSYSQKITRSDELSLSCSLVGVKDPGVSLAYSPVCPVAWRRQFQHVPEILFPERHGTIAGKVFRDDESKGVWAAGMPPMGAVDVVLDDQRHTLSRDDGSYAFKKVPRGKHRVEVQYHSEKPFFLTTESGRDVAESAIVNFGIGYSKSGLVGHVLNDAGQGVGDVTVRLQKDALKWTCVTEADGGFFVSALLAGEYEVKPDEDSLPSGYATEGLDPQKVTVGASSPGKADFTVRAIRSITGRVLSYDPASGRYIAVVGAKVVLQKSGASSTTDATGRYLFGDLAAGSYTITVQNGAQASTRAVQLTTQPVALIDVDFQIGAGGH